MGVVLKNNAIFFVNVDSIVLRFRYLLLYILFYAVA